ncbi:MAG TPA: hypothetical protein VLX58_16745 [Bryobacteraceae bacterium]|nr:hypothetical protein [Bryobacteraceae bacterium]
MCDYSLHGLPNRLATEGEELVAHRFSTGAIGLTSPAELCRATMSRNRSEKKGFWSMFRAAVLPPVFVEAPAVCIPPGARLRIMGVPPALQRELGVGAEETVTFTQTTAMPNTYHDAIRFENGRQVLLQILREGVRVRVLSLASSETEDLVLDRTGSESLV